MGTAARSTAARTAVMGAGDVAEAWGRRRLLGILAGVVLAVVLVLVGLAYAVFFAIGSAATDTTAAGAGAGDATGAPTAAGEPPEGDPERAQGQVRRDEIATAPMLSVDPQDARATAPAAVFAPSITIPPATTSGPVTVPSGFPRTPEGAVGQLAAIETTVLAAMSISQVGATHEEWVMPGGPEVAQWELTRNVQAFLEAAEMGGQMDLAATVVATPVAAQVKGVDGPDWVLACVLLDVRATIVTDARMGYGACERMEWDGERWLIAAGPAPARAPSTWPGSERSTQAGWRTWVEDAGDS